jgi:hypothetical protein
MMMKGSMKLSNCAARIKNINTKANPKAKAVFELLSTKSRDSPPKSVVKVSSKNFSLNVVHCINSVAYTFAWSKTAEIVAAM